MDYRLNLKIKNKKNTYTVVQDSIILDKNQLESDFFIFDELHIQNKILYFIANIKEHKKKP